MTQFCAICTSSIGPFTREPLGRGDALVLACARCVSEEVVPRDPLAGARGLALFDPDNPVAVHRAELYARGLCVRGAAHGPPVEGRRHCAACIARSKAKAQKRVRGRGRVRRAA